MNNITRYLRMSERLLSFATEFITSGELKDNFLELSVEEQKALLNHYVADGRSAVLKDKPLLYDQIISYMAGIGEVPVSHVKIIGSFKLGFCTGSKYGRLFDGNRDVDMAIFDDHLFDKIIEDFKKWQLCYGRGECMPKNDNEKRYWDDNIRIIGKKIEEGFIDTYRLPNRSVCPTIMKLHQASYLIELKLKEYHNVSIKKHGVSIRVYRTFDDFINTLLYNTIRVIENNKNIEEE